MVSSISSTSNLAQMISRAYAHTGIQGQGGPPPEDPLNAFATIDQAQSGSGQEISSENPDLLAQLLSYLESRSDDLDILA